MALADRRAARSRALVQDHIPEQVLAAGSVVAAAAPASRFGATSGGLGFAIGARGERQAPDGAPQAGFAPRTWLGITATRVYAFASERGEVGALIGVWDRSTVTVTKVARLASTRLYLRFGASEVGLDARRCGAGNRQLLRYLLDPTRA